MKNTKKIITLALAAAMLSATGITAFAETTNVSYDVQPTYTVSIPAAVTLSDADVTADITASNVILEDGKQIKVDLTVASNTASGSTFNAKNGNSAVTYTITGDKAIAVGDTVATFAANGSKTLTFSAANKSAATVAGTHTETLTFGISVEDASVAVTGISLNKTSSIIALNENDTLEATVTPEDATDTTVTWSSDNPSVATVDSTGKITGVSVGTANITAKAGDKSAICEVTVGNRITYTVTMDAWNNSRSTTVIHLNGDIKYRQDYDVKEGDLQSSITINGDIITIKATYSAYGRTYTINTANSTYTDVPSGSNATWDSKFHFTALSIDGEDIFSSLTKV